MREYSATFPNIHVILLMAGGKLSKFNAINFEMFGNETHNTLLIYIKGNSTRRIDEPNLKYVT